jgi:serine/threonine protein kinase
MRDRSDGCLSENELLAYANRTPGGRTPATARVQEHLDGCDECRELLAVAIRARRSGPDDVTSGGEGTTLGPGQTLLDRYRVVKFIARGGMGEVYEARDLLLDEVVALKTLVSTALDDDGASFRFRAEARLARRVTHRNVCRILEFGVHRQDHDGLIEATPFLTMEFLRGETLRSRIERTGAATPEALQPIFDQVLQGLSAIHEAGIVHRDLKSENVFLVSDGARAERAVVMDFGLARALDGSVVSTWPRTRTLAGTLDTMAPEQIAGSTVKPAADLFAAGIILFELVTGTRPFQNVPPLKRLSATAPRPSLVRPGIDPRWDDILGRCLHLDPRRRHSSAEHLRTEVANLTGGRPTRRPWLRRLFT